MKKSLYIILLMLFSTGAFSQVSFLPYQATPIGSSVDIVCIADVNNDGLEDVVVGTDYYFDPVNDYKLFVFIQNQQGALNTPIVYPYPESAGIESMTVVDVNNDNLNDVVIAFGDSLGIFYQNTTGTLSSIQSYYSGTGANGVKCGDINNDGLTDIAVSHWNESFIRVFYQNASGFSNQSYPKVLGGWDEIDVGDVNSDGLDDVIFMAGAGQVGGIHVYIQNSDGTLNTSQSYYSAPSIWNSLNGIAIGDLNDDQHNDVVASMGGNTPNSKLVLWFQDTVSGLLQSPPLEIATYDIPEPIEITDLNCDGKNEIVVVHGGWLKLSVFEQDSLGQYNIDQRFELPYATHYKPHGMSIGDVNGDGREDIAIADYNHGLVLLINDSELGGPSQLIENYLVIDTTYTGDFVTTSQFSISNTEVVEGYEITETSSYFVTNVFHEDSIRTDSIFVSVRDVCGTEYVDTSIVSYYDYRQWNALSDTVFIASITDTVNVIGDIRIYPNPTSGVVVVELSAPYDTKDLNVSVYDDAGRLVLKEAHTNDSNKRQIDLSNWAKGTYMISLRSGKYKSVIKKVVKR